MLIFVFTVQNLLNLWLRDLREIKTMLKDNGFTLVELMVAIAVISIMAAVGTTSIIKQLPDLRLNKSARDLQSAMQFARLKAVKENAPVVIIFVTGSDNYYAFVDNGEGGGLSNNQIQDGTERTVRTGGMPTGIDMYLVSFGGAAGPAVAFNVMGLPSGFQGSVSIMNNLGNYRKITVSSAGNSRIQTSTDDINWYDE